MDNLSTIIFKDRSTRSCYGFSNIEFAHCRSFLNFRSYKFYNYYFEHENSRNDIA